MVGLEELYEGYAARPGIRRPRLVCVRAESPRQARRKLLAQGYNVWAGSMLPADSPEADQRRERDFARGRQ
jgi:hypothetical protein